MRGGRGRGRGGVGGREVRGRGGERGRERGGEGEGGLTLKRMGARGKSISCRSYNAFPTNLPRKRKNVSCVTLCSRSITGRDFPTECNGPPSGLRSPPGSLLSFLFLPFPRGSASMLLAPILPPLGDTILKLF